MLPIEEIFESHRGKSVLLDSNLLLVLLTGTVEPHLLGRFKRVSGYTLDDFDLLVHLVNSFSSLLNTPHILTEVSNLANSLPEAYKHDWYQNLAALIASEQRRGIPVLNFGDLRQLRFN